MGGVDAPGPGESEEESPGFLWGSQVSPERFPGQPRAPGRFPVPPECFPGASSLRRPKSL